MHTLLSWVVYGLLWPISILPLRVLYLFSHLIYFLLCRVFSYRKAVIYINLARSFPEKKYPELQKMARQFYHYFADIMLESIWLATASKKARMRRFRMTNPEVLNELYQKGRSVMLLMGHHGNWELISTVATYSNAGDIAYPAEKVGLIYKAPENPIMDKVFLYMRNNYKGGHLLESKQAARFMVSHKGDPRIYVFIADQSPLPGARFCVDFLHQPTLMVNGPELLSRKTDLAVVYVKMLMEKRGHYVATFQPICESPLDLPDGEITKKFAELLEQNIIEQPYIWLWSHKRWKRGLEEMKGKESPKLDS